MNVNPNFSSTILDRLHNEIFDRDEVVNRLLTEVDTQRKQSITLDIKQVVLSVN